MKLNMPKVITNKCIRFDNKNKNKMELFYNITGSNKKKVEIITPTILKRLLLDPNHQINYYYNNNNNNRFTTMYKLNIAISRGVNAKTRLLLLFQYKQGSHHSMLLKMHICRASSFRYFSKSTRLHVIKSNSGN